MHADEELVRWAAGQAKTLLAPLGMRWLHVQGVVEKAYQVSGILCEAERPYLVAAAYLHNVGYAPSLQRTGFHPLDGAYYLQSLRYERLASLVAHHSEARFEAQLRRGSSELDLFPRERTALADALTYSDLTASSTGEGVSLKERVNDILALYGEQDIVAQVLRQSMPYVSLAVALTKQRLCQHEISVRAS